MEERPIPAALLKLVKRPDGKAVRAAEVLSWREHDGGRVVVVTNDGQKYAGEKS